MSPFEELRNGETLGFKKAQDIGLPRINIKRMWIRCFVYIKYIQDTNKIFVV